jgi:Zn-dependent protease with chaperone function
MKDFFAQQDRARAASRRLVAYFLFGVLVLAGTTVAIVVILLPEAFGLGQLGYVPAEELWPYVYGNLDWFSVVGVAAGLSGAFCLVSFARVALLASGGGTAVAESLGGRLVLEPETEEDRRLVNVVEEMAIASGVPMPSVYVLDGDDSINAFAAGTAVDRAVVAVTRGTLRELSRDELQGVVAHEFSHILNGDMRLNLRIVGVLFGILFLREAGYLLFRLGAESGSSRRSRDDDARARLAIVGIGAALFVLGSVGYLVGLWIKAAVSREREYLADASAVQFTRNPHGIGGALRKIARVGSRLQSPRASEVNHFLLASGVRGLTGFATHPPIEERIRRLLGEEGLAAEPQTVDASPRGATQVPGLRSSGGATRAFDFANPIAAAAVAVAASDAATTRNCQGDDGLPPAVSAASRDPFSARALACLLLLGDRPTEEAWSRLEASGGAVLAATTRTLFSEVGAVSAQWRIDALGRALPALRQLSPDQSREFLRAAKALIELDGEVALHEFLMWRLLKHALGEPARPDENVERDRAKVPAAAAMLLSVMADQGATAADAAEKAYAAGWEPLAASGLGRRPEKPTWTKASLATSLKSLESAPAETKKHLLAGLAAAARRDGTLVLEELELLRTVAILLGTPIPPPRLAQA